MLLQLKKAIEHHGEDWLTLESAIEAVSSLARFPFFIKPGDHFKTRPDALDPLRPIPKCREWTLNGVFRGKIAILSPIMTSDLLIEFTFER